MAPNTRIVLNAMATYGRSLFAMLLGIFSSRWVLMSLGQVDYGLFGVVGGIVVFIGFFNMWLTAATSRFYAYSIGRANVAEIAEEGLEECRKWFNTALFIHTVVPCLLIMFGYPVGVLAIKDWLVIPPDRIQSCIWVFRFACVSCFVGMINVPFAAMYTAKQYIAELTVYGVMTTTMNFCFVLYMVTHPGDWLVRYSLGTSLISCTVSFLICIRACRVFPECRFRLRYLVDLNRFKAISGYAGWQIFGALGWMLQTQGVTMLVNKFYGPRVNASMTVASAVNGHSASLATALMGAFLPAITTACGEGDFLKMRKMAFCSCKFSMIASLVFVLPLSLELSYVVKLWLKEPPPFVVGLCVCMMFAHVMNSSSIGHMSAVLAKGKIALYQVVLGGTILLAVPIAAFWAAKGYSVYAVAIVVFVLTSIHAILRVVFAKWLVGMSPMKWVAEIMLPIVVVSCVSIGTGLIIRLVMQSTLLRVIATSFVVEVTFLPMVWLLVLNDDERKVVADRFTRISVLRKYLKKG